MQNPNEKFVFYIGIVGSIVTILMTVINVILTAYSVNADVNKKEFDSQDMIKNYNIKVTELILDSIESSDTRKQKIAYGLAKTISDRDLSNVLISALASSGTPISKLQIRKDIRVNKAKQLTKEKFNQEPQIEDLNFSKLKHSIFFCGNYPEQEGVARAYAGSEMYNVLEFSRIDRAKQTEIFGKGGPENLILYNKKDESIVRLLENDLASSQLVSFKLIQSNLPPGTMSIYFCGPTYYQRMEEINKAAGVNDEEL